MFDKLKSLTGWEKSHFGGFRKVIFDHPFIQLNYQVDIKSGTKLKEDLGYSAQTLVKIYLLKLMKNGLLGKLVVNVIEEPNFMGVPTKYEVISLNDRKVLKSLIGRDTELAPLFDHYAEGILETLLYKEIKDPSEDGEGKGKGDSGEDGEDENEGSGKSKSEGDADGDGEGEEGERGAESRGSSSPVSEENSIRRDLEAIRSHEPKALDTLGSYDKKPTFHNIKKGKVCKFSFEERKDAANLLRLLDISFDPTSDTVKNLRIGKLDVSKIAEVPAGNVSVYTQTLEEQDTKPFSVCILADMSGSMSGSKIEMQKRVMNSLYLAFRQILPKDKLFIYGHTGSNEPHIYKFCTPLNSEYEEYIHKYDAILLEQNYDGPVIEAVHNEVRNQTSDRIIFIVLSDGSPSGYNYGGHEDVNDMKKIIERARRDEFVTVGVGIQADHVKHLYNYSTVVRDLSKMSRDVSQIINKVVRTEFK